jgi:NitT/TauT family transport system substrate-binding protein
VAEAERVFGGPMPAGCLYAPVSFIEDNPRTVRALAAAIVRADRWIQQASPADVLKTVPESYLLGDRDVYVEAFQKAKQALSPDGLFPDGCAATALHALASADPELLTAKLDLQSVYTNEFVKMAGSGASHA